MAFKTLGEVLKIGEEGFPLLTLRSTKAFLQRNAAGKRQFIVKVSDETEVITSSRERREHFKTANRQWLEEQLAVWRNGVPVDIAIDDHPLEVITGDVCPLLVINGEEYIPSILRDIPPIGWLLPGGCPANLDEILHVDYAALREMQEELLIGDAARNVYSSRADEEGVRASFTAATGINPAKIKIIPVEHLVMNVGDADELVIWNEGHAFRTMLPIFVDPEIASTAATLYLWLLVPVQSLEELRLFDGEVLPNGTALKRPVRLLKKDGTFAALYLRGNYVPMTDGWITKTTGRQSAFR